MRNGKTIWFYINLVNICNLKSFSRCLNTIKFFIIKTAWEKDDRDRETYGGKDRTQTLLQLMNKESKGGNPLLLMNRNFQPEFLLIHLYYFIKF